MAPRAFRAASLTFGFGSDASFFSSSIAPAAFGPNRANASMTNL